MSLLKQFTILARFALTAIVMANLKDQNATMILPHSQQTDQKAYQGLTLSKE